MSECRGLTHVSILDIQPVELKIPTATRQDIPCGTAEIVQDPERINGVLDSQSQTYQMCRYEIHSKNRSAQTWPGPCSLKMMIASSS